MKKYSIKEDHVKIKKQIKNWEKDIDNLINSINDDKVVDILEKISHEMFAINY